MSLHKHVGSCYVTYTLNLCKYYKKTYKLTMSSIQVLLTQFDDVSKWLTIDFFAEKITVGTVGLKNGT